MKQKIIKVGNSAAIIIPKHVMMEKGLAVGDTVAFRLEDRATDEQGYHSDRPTLTPEFKEWLDQFMKDYKPILDDLAHL